MTRRIRVWLAGATAAATVLATITPTAVAEPPARPPATPITASAAPGAHDVTLITGDRVQVTAGAHPRATVLQTAPGTTAYAIFQAGGDLYVIPDQAMASIARGQVDKKLFDVTGLVAQGYGDASTQSLPVIVEYGGTELVPQARPAGVQQSQVLPAIHGVAEQVAKPDAAQFWHAMTATHTLAPSKLWLDAQVRATDDLSAAQIGAPAAWQRGLDGQGVTVAVLDSGIDTTHPDLAGKLVDAQNFTDESDTDDHLGHGTHVASIIAGTGAASAGKYAGIAHGATLLNGKVMKLAIVDPGIPVGTGRESWILAGMQWAVDRGAKIVNMSLGNSYPDGNDPLSVAVNDLTERYGTLFVVSAGNDGPGHYTVGGPAAADDALAVGSVDRDDTVSSFSSRGPRMIDGVIKPELTAPGQGIIAARAAHGRIGQRVGDSYVALSGTSMAAPHVAAAAAILLQEHPDWTQAQLRAALTSTAAYNPAFDGYSQGAGRIDVDRATRQDATVDSGTLNLGYFAADATTLHASKTLTYHNASSTPVTLTLNATATQQSGAPAPPGTLAVSPAMLTVPAGGSADATVTVELTGRPAGAYYGRVVASGPDGLQLGTTVGFVRQGQEVQATFRAIDRDGHASEAFLVLQDPSQPFSFLLVDVPPGGSSTVQLDPGDYSLLGYIRTPYRDTDYNTALTVVANPDLHVAQPNPTITYDARRAQPLGVQVARDVDVNGLTVGLQTERPGLDPPTQDSFVFAHGPGFGGTIHPVPMTVLPFDKPRVGHGELDSYWSLVSPRARATVIAPRRSSLPVALMDGSARLNATYDLPVVDAGSGDLKGKIALAAETPGTSFTDQATAAEAGGAVALLISAAEPGPFFGVASADIPVLAISQADGDQLRALGSPQVRLSGTSSSTYLYDLAFREHDRVQHDTVYHPGNLAAVRTSYHADDSRTQQRFFERRFPAFDSVCGYCGDSAREGEDWNGATTRLEYVTPGVAWQESLIQDGFLQWNAVRSYPPGVSSTSWDNAPVVPGVLAQRPSTRDGDQLHLRLAGATDSDPSHFADVASFWVQGAVTLSRDGTPLGSCATFEILNCDVDVPVDEATYTLTANAPAPVFTDAWQSSTTTWTFHSRHGEATLPLVDVDDDLDASPTNTLDAGRPAMLRLGVSRQAGSTGGALGPPSVQVSYDDGATWASVPVLPQAPGHYQVLFVPRAGRLGLRVSVQDADGDGVVQEIPRAVRVTG